MINVPRYWRSKDEEMPKRDVNKYLNIIHYGHDDGRIRPPDGQSTHDSLRVYADAAAVREDYV